MFIKQLFCGRRAHGRHHGFSLVELTISIGVVAFTLLPVIAITSGGFSSLRDSSERTAIVSILDGLAAQASSEPWPTVASNSRFHGGPPFYFTWDGLPQESMNADSIFEARTTLIDGPSLLGGSSEFGRLLQIEVRRADGGTVKEKASSLLVRRTH